MALANELYRMPCFYQLFDVPGGMFGFAPAVNFAAGDGTSAVASADLDGDGDLDLAATNQTDDTVSILLNDGTGTFAAGAILPVTNSPNSVEAADLDNDGDADIVVTNLNSATVSILLNNGDGTFLAATDFGA